MKEKYEKVLIDFVTLLDDKTAYKTVKVTEWEVRKKCVKCGRIRIFYCKDENFKFCDNCGRSIMTTEDLEKLYGKTVLEFAVSLREGIENER